MPSIDTRLATKIRKKLGIGKSRFYQLIQQKVAATHLERRLAAIVLASENGISVEQYASADDLATIRGSTKSTLVQQSTGQATALKKIIKVEDPLDIDLDAVSSKELRQILRRDISELNAARSQGYDKTAKTCMVLAGSIVEAMLLSALKKRKKAALNAASTLPKNPGSDPEKWDLFEMVEVATRLNPPLLPADAETGADQLRKWRNLVHPGRELREAKTNRVKPSAGRARNAVAFLQFVADELQA
jgi:hypothetical protein